MCCKVQSFIVDGLYGVLGLLYQYSSCLIDRSTVGIRPYSLVCGGASRSSNKDTTEGAGWFKQVGYCWSPSEGYGVNSPVAKLSKVTSAGT